MQFIRKIEIHEDEKIRHWSKYELSSLNDMMHTIKQYEKDPDQFLMLENEA
jgi:hypothetical protein